MQTLTINSVDLQDADFLDTATGFLDGTLLNRYKATIKLTFTKNSLNKRLQFTSSGGINTISNIDGLDTDSFVLDDGWAIGNKIIVPASIHNSGQLTITAVADRVITISETLTNEQLEVGNIYLATKITALDFFYNLIGNNEAESYLSKIDAGVLQRYIATGIDTTVSTGVSLLIGSPSNAWVTDTLTGTTSQATISGTNASFGTGSNYEQTFTITHYFFQIQFIGRNYLGNFQNKTAPSQYSDSYTSTGIQGMKYISSISAKFVDGPVVEATGNWISTPGNAAWLNQNNSRTVPDFTIGSITYVDNATSDTLNVIDFTKTVNVTIVIKSASGAFTSSTKVVLNHLYLPLAESDYQDTLTTLRQNIMHDRAVLTVGAGAINGEFYGTDYSIIQLAQAVKDSANQVTITFKAIYASALQAILTARPGNRNYGFITTTE